MYNSPTEKNCAKFYKVSYFVHSVRPQTQYTILLKVKTNSVHSIIFCIRCTHAQYHILHGVQTNSVHCVIFWRQCHILYTVHRKGCAHKLSTLCHILDTVSYFAEGCAVHTNSAGPSMSEAGSAFDCKTMQKEQCCKEDALCQVFIAV